MSVGAAGALGGSRQPRCGDQSSPGCAAAQPAWQRRFTAGSSGAAAGVDPPGMRRVLTWLLLAVLAAFGRAQDREATVELDDGEVIAGAVVAMDLASLQIRVGGEVRTIPATRIRSCRFTSVPQPAGEPAGTAPAADPAAADGTAAPDPEAAAAPAPAKPAARITWKRPLPDPVDPTAEAVPVDLRGQSRLRQRLAVFTERYPWLAPATPSQWLSMALLSAILACFVVHCGAKVAGAETPGAGRSTGLAAWYLLSGLLQLAMVPVNDLTVVLMLLGNTSLALFWLRSLYGLSRLAAVIALAVQLGFVVLGYGVLELVSAILGSVAPPGA